MGPSQICGCPFREPRVFTIAHICINIVLQDQDFRYVWIDIFDMLQLSLFTIPQWAQPPISWLGSATKFPRSFKGLSGIWTPSLGTTPAASHVARKAQSGGQVTRWETELKTSNHQGSISPWFSQFVQVPTRRCCWCCQRMDRPKGKAFRSPAAWGWNFINFRWQ